MINASYPKLTRRLKSNVLKLKFILFHCGISPLFKDLFDLKGEYVGIKETDVGIMKVYYGLIVLG